MRESALFELSKLYKYRDRFSEARTVLLSAIELRGRMGARDGEADSLEWRFLEFVARGK